MQVKRNAFSNVLGQPPTRITGLIGRAIDGRVQPSAVELKELTRVAAQIWKFFFQRDHDSLDPVEIIHAALSQALPSCPTRGWHRRIDRHLRSADGSRHNADMRFHRRAAQELASWWNASRKPWQCCRRASGDRKVRAYGRASRPGDRSARFPRKW